MAESEVCVPVRGHQGAIDVNVRSDGELLKCLNCVQTHTNWDG